MKDAGTTEGSESPAYTRLGQIVAFELSTQRMEMQALMNLLVEHEIIGRDDGIAFLARLAANVEALQISPAMKDASAARVRHYEMMAASLSRR